MSEFEEQFETCEFMGCGEGNHKCHTLPTIVPTLPMCPSFFIVSSMSPDDRSPLRLIIDTKYDDDEKKPLKKLNWIQVCVHHIKRNLLTYLL